jgi:hypothetical protein
MYCGIESDPKEKSVNPGLKAWDFCGWRGLRTPAKPFLNTRPLRAGFPSEDGSKNKILKRMDGALNEKL